MVYMESMKIVSVEEKEGQMQIEYETHDVSLFELVVDRLNKAKGVEAYYQKPHPLIPKVKLIIKAKDPKKALQDVVKKLEKELK